MRTSWPGCPPGRVVPKSRYNAAGMRSEAILIALGLAAILEGCSGGDDREWMKISEKYTTEEFRRDYAECTRGGKLDEECMKRRGWVAVTAPKQEDKPFGDPYGGRDARPRTRY